MKANPSHRSRSASPAARTLSALAVVGMLAISHGCSGGTKGDPDNRGAFLVTGISTGSGSVYPYRIRTTDSFGNPTSTVVNIESEATLKQFVNGSNGVLPVATLPLTPVLPDGSAGNQFLHFTFSHKLDVDSILSNLLADQANSGLGGQLTILAYNPSTEQQITVQGRGFVNGTTYYNEAGTLRKVQAVVADGNDISVVDPRAAGFPSYPGAADLVSTKSFTFVADSDSTIVRGLIAVLLVVYSGRPAGEIVETDVNDLFDRLGLANHLTSKRRNGFASMVQRIKALAAAAA